MKKVIKNTIKFLSLASLGLVIGLFIMPYFYQTGQNYHQKIGGKIAGLATKKDQKLQNDKKEACLAFTQDVFDIINNNYWAKLSEKDLSKLYMLAISKAHDIPTDSNANNMDVVYQKIKTLLKKIDKTDKKNELCLKINQLVTINLEPYGRSSLYTKEHEEKLSNTVNNIDPETDQYQELGVEKNASQKEIKETYQEKKQELAEKLTKETSNQPKEVVKKEIEKIERAYDTLKDEESRKVYDISGAESTMSYKLLTDQIFYLKIKKFSPQTVEELNRVSQKIPDQADALILDLRDNIGGAIDGLPYFLGPFIGINRNAYQFVQKEEPKDFTTKIDFNPKLKQFKRNVILINKNTKSTAEVMSSVLKKYNFGVVIGETTSGWGTIERIFPIERQLSQDREHSIFLVHHLTLRADGSTIEGNGINPDIRIKDKNWPEQLKQYYHDEDLVKEVEKLY